MWDQSPDSISGSDSSSSNFIMGQAGQAGQTGISSLPRLVDWKCPLRAGKASGAASRLSGCACREHVAATCVPLEIPIAPGT